jgi:hypothetical protein
MNEQQVREAIDALIARKEQRIRHLESITKGELQSEKRMLTEHTITCIQHGVDTLIELQHILRICGCPDEAYKEV